MHSLVSLIPAIKLFLIYQLGAWTNPTFLGNWIAFCLLLNFGFDFRLARSNSGQMLGNVVENVIYIIVLGQDNKEKFRLSFRSQTKPWRT